MNNTQKKVLWTGIITVVLMAVFPPVRETVFYGDSLGVANLPSVHYKLLFEVSAKNIVYGRLFLQCFITIIITGGLTYAFKTGTRPDTKPRTRVKKGDPINYPIDRIIYKDEDKTE